MREEKTSLEKTRHGQRNGHPNGKRLDIKCSQTKRAHRAKEEKKSIERSKAGLT